MVDSCILLATECSLNEEVVEVGRQKSSKILPLVFVVATARRRAVSEQSMQENRQTALLAIPGLVGNFLDTGLRFHIGGWTFFVAAAGPEQVGQPYHLLTVVDDTVDLNAVVGPRHSS